MSLKRPPETSRITIVSRFSREELPIPEWLRRERDEAGLTQREIAGAAGMAQPQIAEYERGKTEPRTETIQRLARVYGKRPEFVLSDEETGRTLLRLVTATLSVSHGPQPVVSFQHKDGTNLVIARHAPWNAWMHCVGRAFPPGDEPWPVLVCEGNPRRNAGPAVALIGQYVTVYQAKMMPPDELLLQLAHEQLLLRSA